jgi:hypothetical protein
MIFDKLTQQTPDVDTTLDQRWKLVETSAIFILRQTDVETPTYNRRFVWRRIDVWFWSVIWQ